MSNAERAAMYRKSAQAYEILHMYGSTCGNIPKTEVDAYQVAFGFGDEAPRCKYGLMSQNERDLWDSVDRHEIRILLLCFAAAMCETGDL